MKVALVHYSLKRGGGMESYLADLARGFRAAGDEVDVWARNVDRGFAKELGVRAFRLAPIPLPRLWRNRAFAARIARLDLRARYPLVIALSRTRGHHLAINGGTHPGFLAAMQRRPGRHDHSEIALERAMLADARAVVAHSALLGAEIGRHYPESMAKTVVIYPPLDGERFHADAAGRTAARRAFGLADDARVFLFPSMDHARKGLAPLLEAFALLDDSRACLLVAGREVRGELPPRVRTLGYVADMPALFRAVDWTVLPSRYEPFGLVVAESLACGTPAIVGAAAGVAELMDEADGIRLAALDAPAILTALRAALAAPPRRVAGFAERHGLSLAAHVAALKRAAGV